LLLGLSAMREGHLMHRDLKPENIMVCPCDDDSVCVKIVDFGYCKPVGQDQLLHSLGVGNMLYRAPECYEHGSAQMKLLNSLGT
ncbi:hypothetical protein KIPB_013935, partial [Kipferlia bialata]